MSYMRARARRTKKRPQGHRGFAAMGDSSMPDYCFVLDENYFQLPGVPGTNGVPDYATALATCSAAGASGLTSDCARQATADAAKFAAGSADLRSNWNPTGDDFAPDDLWKIVSQMLTLSSQANTALIGKLVAVGMSDGDKWIIQTFADALSDVNTQSINYKTAINQAKQAGAKAVHAPGLKDWVTSSLDTFAQAVYQGSDVACNEPWWAGALETVFAVVQVIVTVCKTVGAIALAVGEKVVTAVEGGLDMIAMIEKIAPFAAIGLAAWWLFLREKKRGEKVFAL